MSKNGIRSMVISLVIGLIFWASVSKPITGFITWLISLV
ncbi:Uncharacterised protein [Raoultella terrigena]|jgi:hypothetical protein|uniref:Uncharacterized protein n=1 Tax=Raoultella terrigena TaxID=577 RepID=A0A4U9DH06_RAOTE|nr:Uncharacterised protein [Raoultella terrigena]